MFPNVIDRAIAIALAALVLILAPTAAWNWWRKGVYYDALQTVADDRAKKIKGAQADLDKKLDAQALDLYTRSNARERTLQKQIDEISSRKPADRVQYVLRDRWLPATCPSGAVPGAAPVEIGGLRTEDELFLVRFAAAADQAVDERNSCVGMYQTARDAALKANK